MEDVPKESKVIYKTAASLVISSKAQQGTIFVADRLIFIPKKPLRQWYISVEWRTIKKITKINRMGLLDKGIEVTTSAATYVFLSVRDRDCAMGFIKQMADYSLMTAGTVGFSKQSAMIPKIQFLKGTTLVESTVNAPLDKISEVIGCGDDLAAFIASLGNFDVYLTNYKNITSGFQREFHYTKSGIQPIYQIEKQRTRRGADFVILDSTITMNKSGDNCVAEASYQMHFKADGTLKVVKTIRWNDNVWDKEFLDTYVSRYITMLSKFITLKAEDKEFILSEHEGEWKQHQTYLAVIATLVVTILILILSPKTTDFVKIIIGLFALVILILS